MLGVDMSMDMFPDQAIRFIFFFKNLELLGMKETIEFFESNKKHPCTSIYQDKYTRIDFDD